MGRICFAILAHDREDSLEDLLDSIRVLAPKSTSVLYNGGRDPAYGARLGLPVCPSSRPLRWGRLARVLLDIMTWLTQVGLDYDFLVYVENDMLLIKPGFEIFLDRELRDHEYMAVNFRSVDRPDGWIPGQRFLATWRRTWQPVFGMDHPFGCFNPGQVFSRRSVEAILAYPRLREIRERASRTSVPCLEELLHPTLVVATGGRGKPYPPSQGRAIRWKRYHAFDELTSYLKDPDVFLLHPIGMPIDSPDRVLLRSVRRTPDHIGPGVAGLFTRWPPEAPRRTLIQESLTNLRTMWIRLRGH